MSLKASLHSGNEVSFPFGQSKCFPESEEVTAEPLAQVWYSWRWRYPQLKLSCSRFSLPNPIFPTIVTRPAFFSHNSFQSCRQSHSPFRSSRLLRRHSLTFSCGWDSPPRAQFLSLPSGLHEIPGIRYWVCCLAYPHWVWWWSTAWLGPPWVLGMPATTGCRDISFSLTHGNNVFHNNSFSLNMPLRKLPSSTSGTQPEVP